MLSLAISVLGVSAVLSAVAILSFSWSAATAKAALPRVLLAAGIGSAAIGAWAASSVAAQPQSGLAVWAFLFAGASCGSNLNAARNLFSRPTRWIHRFTIYSGYGAAFAAMGAVALGLQARAASNRLAALVLISAYVVGSACILVAKTLIVRRAAKTMPEYQAWLDAEENQGYW